MQEAVSVTWTTGETCLEKGPPKTIEVGWGKGSGMALSTLDEFGYTQFGRYISLEDGKITEFVDKTEGSAF